MQPKTGILKPGEFTEELQDYKIIELEQYTIKRFDELNQNQEEMNKTLNDIKDYIFHEQSKQIERLDKRVTAIEKRHAKIDKQQENKKKEKHEGQVWFHKTMLSTILTQVIGLIFIIIMIRAGLR